MMLDERSTVFVVERDPRVRQGLECWIDAAGLRVRTFSNPPEFLAGFDPSEAGCLVLRLRGTNGLELQKRLTSGGRPALPMIVFDGAEDRADLLECILHAIDLDRRLRDKRRKGAGIEVRFARLTPRERDVMRLVVAGMANKRIASELGISQKTVEIHRGRVMKKTKAASIADLVRLAEIWTASGGSTGARVPVESTIIHCRKDADDAEDDLSR